MIIYTNHGNLACRQAKKYLKSIGKEFEEINISTHILNRKEVKFILSKSEYGTDQILAKRSKKYNEFKKNINDMTMNQVIELIIKNPTMLKIPILIENDKILFGIGDNEQLTTFKERKPHIWENVGKIYNLE